MKKNQGIRPQFGRQPISARGHWGREGTREEEVEGRWEGVRWRARRWGWLDNTTGWRETIEMKCQRSSGGDRWGLWSWQGCVVSRRPVAQGIDSCPSVPRPIISAHTAPIWSTLPHKVHLEGEPGSACVAVCARPGLCKLLSYRDLCTMTSSRSPPVTTESAFFDSS